MQKDKIFLEDVAKESFPPGNSGDEKVWKLSGLTGKLTSTIYIVTHSLIRHFLLARMIYGQKKITLLEQAFKQIVEPPLIQKVLRELFEEKDCALQILPLKSGLYCSISRYLYGVEPYNIIPVPTLPIEIERKVSGNHVTARSTNTIKKWGRPRWIIICDTCSASGSTLQEAIDAMWQIFNDSLEGVIIVSACCSYQALERAEHSCRNLKLQMVSILGETLFEVVEKKGVLGLEWTDLPVLAPGSISTKTFYKQAWEHNQGYQICAVGNVGGSIGNSLEEMYRSMLELLVEMARLGIDPTSPEWKDTLQHFQLLSTWDPHQINELFSPKEVEAGIPQQYMTEIQSHFPSL